MREVVEAGNKVGIGVKKGGNKVEVSRGVVLIVDERIMETGTDEVIIFEVP